MPTIDTAAARLHYRVEGPADAPVLVLSNSLGTDLHLWDAQIAALTRHRRVLRYDTRGHGGSTASATPCSLADLGNDVLQLLDALAIDRFSICGISLGGMTALWLGIHAPGRVLGIMPCNTAARIGTPAGWEQRIAQIAADGLDSLSPATADATMERWFTAAFRKAHPAPVQATREMLLRTRPAGYLACCAALRDADLTATVASIAAPALIVTGIHDPVTPPADAGFLHRHIAGSRLRTLDASHLSNIEAAPGFLSALLEFIGVED